MKCKPTSMSVVHLLDRPQFTLHTWMAQSIVLGESGGEMEEILLL